MILSRPPFVWQRWLRKEPPSSARNASHASCLAVINGATLFAHKKNPPCNDKSISNGGGLTEPSVIANSKEEFWPHRRFWSCQAHPRLGRGQRKSTVDTSRRSTIVQSKGINVDFARDNPTLASTMSEEHDTSNEIP